MTGQNTIPRGWKTTTLGEVAEPSKLQWRPGDLEQKYIGLEHINPGQLTINGHGSSSELASNKFYFNVGDTLFGKLRPYFRKVWKAKFDGVCSTDIWVLRPKKNFDKDFLFYFIANPFFVDKSMGANIGTHMPRADWHFLKNTIWPIPPLPEQRAIASVLSSFDDKIELLREQNKTLEATAQAIFKEWFVNFNYPNQDSKPYKASGGKMINSELGEIPVGWRVYNLDELVKVVNGYSYKGSELVASGENALVTLKSFDRKGGFQIRGFKPFNGQPKLKQEVFLGDLIVAHTDLTQDAEVLGNPAFIFDNAGYKKMFITMDLVKILPKKEEFSLGFFYYLMSNAGFKKHCVGYSNGTTVLHLSKRAIPEYKLALPQKLSSVIEFSETAHVITEKIINNFSQIQTLSSLRDIILPKLMKGELRTEPMS